MGAARDPIRNKLEVAHQTSLLGSNFSNMNKLSSQEFGLLKSKEKKNIDSPITWTKTKPSPTTRYYSLFLRLNSGNELDPVSLTVPHNDLWPPLKKILNRI